MKKQYEKVSIEFLAFATSDVITLSGADKEGNPMTFDINNLELVP